jgi:O-antigen/teichoic acid export membrane protein
LDDARTDALHLRARHAATWIIAGHAGTQTIRLASNLVLARLLFAEAFGLMALVNVVVLGLTLFSDVGLSPSIVQDRRGEDPAFLDTAWTIQVVRGALLWAIACAAATPFAQWYGEPLLAQMIPIAACSALIEGFNSTRLYTLERALAPQRPMLVELVSLTTAAVIMIGWASLDRSVWALVAGSLGGSGARLLLSHTILPGHRNRLRWDPSAAAALFRFGRWVFLSTSLTFLASHSDRLIFGKLIPIELLGIYSIGLMISQLPLTIVFQLTRRVTFPVLSHVNLAGGASAEQFHAARWPLLLAAGWGIGGLVAGGATAIRLLYDPRYEAAGWVVQILSLGGWMAILEATYRSALLAQGRAAWMAACTTAKLVGMALLIPAGYHGFGFAGAVSGFAASGVFPYLLAILLGAQIGIRAIRRDLQLTALLLGVSGLAWVASLRLQALGVPVVVEALAIGVLVTLGWLPAVIPLLRRELASRRSRAQQP